MTPHLYRKGPACYEKTSYSWLSFDLRPTHRIPASVAAATAFNDPKVA